jgi:hypothetical protein
MSSHILLKHIRYIIDSFLKAWRLEAVAGRYHFHSM